MPASSSLVAASPCQVSAVSAKSTAPVQGCRTWLSQGPMLSQCFIPPPPHTVQCTCSVTGSTTDCSLHCGPSGWVCCHQAQNSRAAAMNSPSLNCPVAARVAEAGVAPAAAAAAAALDTPKSSAAGAGAAVVAVNADTSAAVADDDACVIALQLPPDN